MTDRLDKQRVDDLRPTQMTVGMIEVTDKRRELAHETKDERHDFLRKHPLPVVRGPGGQLFLIDHHHLARALWEDAFEHGWCETVADFSGKTETAFWQEMQARHWTYPHDQFGRTRTIADLPAHVSGLVDDPYRSLAGEARRRGAYQKVEAPFAEFQWANFFRPKIVIGLGDEGFATALRKAVE
ncbi:MAG: ParB-like protein, partial [Stenotrophobium sp.]